jgi:hypothetical protein
MPTCFEYERLCGQYSLPKKSTRKQIPPSDGPKLILVSSEGTDLPIVVDREPDQWAGIILIPGGPQKETSLIDLFLRDFNFRNDMRGRRLFVKGIIRPFVLDTRITPHVLSLQKWYVWPDMDNSSKPVADDHQMRPCTN